MKYTLIDSESDRVLATYAEADAGKLKAVAARRRGTTLIAARGAERLVTLVAPGTVEGEQLVSTPFGSHRIRVQRGDVGTGAGAAGGAKTVKSSMPGKVVRLMCKVGDVVKKDQPLLILEAMKMENEIRSPMAGTLTEVAAVEGAKVESGALLVKIAPA